MAPPRPLSAVQFVKEEREREEPAMWTFPARPRLRESAPPLPVEAAQERKDTDVREKRAGCEYWREIAPPLCAVQLTNEGFDGPPPVIETDCVEERREAERTAPAAEGSVMLEKEHMWREREAVPLS